MKEYLDTLKFILENGTERKDRTGVGTLSFFGLQMRFNLNGGSSFPLVTTKKVNFSAVVKELLWFLRGETNIKTLGCGIWNEWADLNGELGPIYGKQWRDWHPIPLTFLGETTNIGIDQIQELVRNLRENPLSRRHIVSAWNVDDIPKMALPPCHTMFQCYASEIPDTNRYYMPLPAWNIEPRYYLDLQLYQRSGDMMLGVPFNVASYSLLLVLLAREANMIPRYFIHTLGDAHIYLNHLEGLKEQLSREPRALPRVEIANKPLPYPGCPRDGSVLEPDDFKLIGYDPHPAIKFDVAV